MSYLIEMHYHTPESSYCGKASPKEAFPYYADKGYSAIVITDHYFDGWFENLKRMKWQQKVERWLRGYYAAVEKSARVKINIILGMELRFCGDANDYLIYGFDELFLMENPKLYNLTPDKMRDIADKNGLFFAQAHPFRKMCKPINPKLLHGVEVYNGNQRHNSYDDLAESFAEKNNLIKLSGSDFHQIEDACKGGTYFKENPANSHELASLLFNGGIEKLK